MPSVPRPWPLLLLAAWALSWLAGAAHLVADHGHGPHAGDPFGHLHGGACAHGAPSEAPAPAPLDDDERPGAELTTQDGHECAVLHLWASGSAGAPPAAPAGLPTAQGDAPGRALRAARGSGGVPLLLLAPKNSPPRIRGRVLA